MGSIYVSPLEKEKEKRKQDTLLFVSTLFQELGTGFYTMLSALLRTSLAHLHTENIAAVHSPDPPLWLASVIFTTRVYTWSTGMFSYPLTDNRNVIDLIGSRMNRDTENLNACFHSSLDYWSDHRESGTNLWGPPRGPYTSPWFQSEKTRTLEPRCLMCLRWQVHDLHCLLLHCCCVLVLYEAVTTVSSHITK